MAYAEEALARRLQDEREARGWTPAGLASRLTKIGCPMNQSAIWKIENGTPRRRITFEEAVAFADVFGISLEDLASSQESVVARATDRDVRTLMQSVRHLQVMAVMLERHTPELEQRIEEDDTGAAAAIANRTLIALEVDADIEEWLSVLRAVVVAVNTTLEPTHGRVDDET